jgi:hypothetical protein
MNWMSLCLVSHEGQWKLPRTFHEDFFLDIKATIQKIWIMKRVRGADLKEEETHSIWAS